MTTKPIFSLLPPVPSLEWREVGQALKSLRPDFLLHAGPGAWGFACRTAASALLALYVAYFLQLESPYWAATTALIVANPVYGQVVSKSLFRLIGTAVGGIMALILAALFAQMPLFFLVMLAAWVACCMALATFLSNFQAYGAMLAGYTTAIITLAVVPTAPLNTFDITLARVSAIVVGIVSSAFVSGLFKPGGAALSLEIRMRQAIQETLGLVKMLADDKKFSDPQAFVGIKSQRRQLARQILTLDSLIEFAAVESSRVRGYRDELLAIAGSVLHAITALGSAGYSLSRMTEDQRTDPLLRQALAQGALAAELMEREHALAIPVLREARDHLTLLARRVTAEGHASELVVIHRLKEALQQLDYAAGAWAEWKEGKTPQIQVRPRPGIDFARNRPEAYRNAVRCFLAVIIAGLFWVETSWSSGSGLVTFAAVFCSFSSVQKNPFAFSYAFLIGTVLAIPVAFIADYVFFTKIEGFVPLSLVMIPPLFIGALAAASTVPRIAGIGTAFMVLIFSLMTVTNPMTYNVSGYLNSALAIFGGVACALACTELFLPPNPVASARRIIRSICSEAELLAEIHLSAALPHRAEWESRMYERLADSLPQLVSERKELDILDSAFSALQIGVSLIDLRKFSAGGQLRSPWREEMDQALDRVAEMSVVPVEVSAALFQAAGSLGRAGTRPEPMDEEERTLLVRCASSLQGMGEILAGHASVFTRLRLESGERPRI